MEKISTPYMQHGISAYVLWGLLPLFWQLLEHVPASDVVCHRILWSALCLLVYSFARNGAALLRELSFKQWMWYALCAFVLSINWGTYIWAVSEGYVLASSLGYFLAPLLYVICGVAFLNEQLTRSQIIALLCAAAGLIPLVISADVVTLFVAAALALSIVLYGWLRKFGALSALDGLTVESLSLTPFALLFLLYSSDLAAVGDSYSYLTLLLLFLSGPATLVPLLYYGSAVKGLPLSVLGFLQYISPVLQFLLGVLVFQESLTTERFFAFVFVWTGVMLLSVPSIIKKRRIYKAL